MQKVVIINQSTGFLMVDLINEFTFHYDSVVFMSGSLDILDIGINKKVYHSKLIVYSRN